MTSIDIHSRFLLAKEILLNNDHIFFTNYQFSNEVKIKSDTTPVTNVDLEIEKKIQDIIIDNFPNDGLIGEEFDKRLTKSGYVWTIDPIDGTIAYIHGVPLFATMIGLIYESKICFGIIHFPVIRETVYAISGEGAFWKKANDHKFVRCATKKISTLDQATFCHSGINYFHSPDSLNLYHHLKDRVKYTRSWGDAFGHVLVATGRAHIMVDPSLHIWDVTPIKILIEESGGCFASFNAAESIYDMNSGISLCCEDIYTELSNYFS